MRTRAKFLPGILNFSLKSNKRLGVEYDPLHRNAGNIREFSHGATKTNPECLLDILTKRSLLGNIYPESESFRARAKEMLMEPQTVYAGFDATSSSLHVGNLATIMNLIHFYQQGHRVICVVGDATTQIGDPSGHTRDRKKLDKNLVEKNAICIEDTLKLLFTNYNSHFRQDGDKAELPMIVRNSQWYSGKNVIDFVSDVFREVRVGSLLHKKSISERLKTPHGMNMSEFCYQIFQAYDWIELYYKYQCRFQVGGSDQAGNIYTGHDIIKKMVNSSDSFGFLTPLITHSKTGKKLGKSSDSLRSNTWLRPELTSPHDLYQFFHKTPDNCVEKFLNVFTFYEESYIEDLINNHLRNSQDIWYCQRKLAESVCKLVHGEV